MLSWHELRCTGAKKSGVGNEIKMTLFEKCHLIKGKQWVKQYGWP